MPTVCPGLTTLQHPHLMQIMMTNGTEIITTHTTTIPAMKPALQRKKPSYK